MKKIMKKKVQNLDPLIAGVIYDFAAWLTTRDERITISKHDCAGPMADAVREFLKMREVFSYTRPIFNWKNPKPK